MNPDLQPSEIVVSLPARRPIRDRPSTSRKAYFHDYYLKNRDHIRQLKKVNLRSRILNLLRGIIDRCNNPKNVSYRWYGKKRIKNFLTFTDLTFLWERDQAAMMRRPSIDRIDSNGHYTVKNCRFVELHANQVRAWENKEKRAAAISAGMKRRARERKA